MGWFTKYTGAQIDEALEKGQKLRVVNNGWIRLDSSAANPVDLANLKNPGNYTALYWMNGPDFGSSTISPANITITLINKDLYQFISAGQLSYVRVLLNGENSYGEWSNSNQLIAVTPGPEAPMVLKPNETIWLDTSNPTAPELKLYTNDGWKNIIPEGTMLERVYDPQGKHTDIFQYIDNAVSSISIDSMGAIDEHINNAEIHVTPEEKNQWNNSASIDAVNNAALAIKTDLENKVSQTLETESNNILELTNKTNELEENITTHIENNEIHPSTSKIEEWDSKANGDHTHNLDGSVTIDTDHINGIIPADLLPYDIKERVYLLTSSSELYNLKKNPVHNGDVVCVQTEASDEWYFVVDDSYLGTGSITNDWSDRTISNTVRDWYSVCYGNGKYVTVADMSNMSAYSTDGITWTERQISSTTRNWRSVCYGGGKFVAVADSSNIFAYSTDGITWTERTMTSTARAWRSVCYGGGKFVAVCDGNVFAYSTDGLTWTEKTMISNENWISVCYGNGKFVAVSGGITFAYSTDGLTWIKVIPDSSTSRSWYGVCYGGGAFVAISSGATFAYSTDGVTWRLITVGGTSRQWRSICYGDGKFVAVALHSTIFAYSIDGITWTEATMSSSSKQWYSVCHGNGKFVAISYYNTISAVATLLASSAKAFKKFAVSNRSWSSIINTPTTLEGYGITDAVTLSQYEPIAAEVEHISASLPSELDLSNVAEAHSVYVKAVNDLQVLDDAFIGLDEVISKIEAIAK